MSQTLQLDDYVRGVRAFDRSVLGRALTMVESDRADHRALAEKLLSALSPVDESAITVGISGVPGVGKSTFIDALGSKLTEQGKRVGVLTVDPSSEITGGSILGDKTRMARLANDENAFVRPSPSGGSLGGVARRTREVLTVLKAAGFDVLLIETVGVGQSETTVKEMVDTFLLLLAPDTGDELQGIKRGILEVVDLIGINKADGPRLPSAKRAAHQYRTALKILRSEDHWNPTVHLVSSTEESGLEEIWTSVLGHRRELEQSGALEKKRKAQRVQWLWRIIEDRWLEALKSDPNKKAQIAKIEEKVAKGDLTPTEGADELLS